MARTLTRLPPSLLVAAMLAAAALPLPAAGPQRPFSPPAMPAPAAAPVGGSGDAAADTPAALVHTLDGLRTGTHPRALIGGRWLALGDPVDASTTLAAVDPVGAVLRHDSGRLERLSLLSPTVQVVRQPALPGPGAVRPRPTTGHALPSGGASPPSEAGRAPARPNARLPRAPSP